MCCGDTIESKQVTRIKKYDERSCTDIPFLLLFVLSWVGVFIILTNTQTMGADPQKVLRGVDYTGKICRDTNKFAAWPYPPEFNFKICVSSCNATRSDPRMNLFYETTPFLDAYCVPSLGLLTSNNTAIQFSDGFKDGAQSAAQTVGDMLTAWPVILASGFIAILMAFVYCWLVERIGGCLVWFTIIIMALAGFLISYALLQKAKEVSDSNVDPDRAKALQGVGYTALACSIIYCLVIFFLRDRIYIAVEIVKEASRALRDIPSLVTFPVFPFLFVMGYFVLWIAVAVFIFSVSDPTSVPVPSTMNKNYPSFDDSFWVKNNVANYTRYAWNKNLQKSFAYHFFHLLWVVQYMIYFCFLVVAGAIANWYFTPRDNDGNKVRGSGDGQLSSTPVVDSVWRTIRFHLGTIAIGSLIIAIIQFIRAVVTYLQEKSKTKEPNRVQQCIFCLVQCCLKCFQTCIDKVNKNAYIWTAIWGDSFGTACCSSFQLIWRNLARVAAINLVGDFLLTIGEVVVAVLTAGISGMIFLNAEPFKTNLSSIVMPCVVIFILAFCVASLFMVIYETAISTIFLCFLVDEEHNKGGNMLAHPDLIKIVDTHQAASQAKADQLKLVDQPASS